MNTAQAPFAPITPFRYVGGDPSIDFVNTTDWTDRGRELDQFTSYGRLLDWADGADLLDIGALVQLRGTAEAWTDDAARVIEEAVQLRGTLERLYFQIARGKRAWSEVNELNSVWLAHALTRLALADRGDGSFELGWEQIGRSLDAPLWAVAWAAAKLLASEDVSRIRRCGGTDCGWYYVDRSRNGLRRWCQMETCGTRMKSRRRAERNDSASPVKAPLTTAADLLRVSMGVSRSKPMLHGVASAQRPQ